MLATRIMMALVSNVRDRLRIMKEWTCAVTPKIGFTPPASRPVRKRWKRIFLGDPL